VLGQSFNPVAEMSSADLATRVQDRFENIQNMEQVGEETTQVAGSSTTVGEFEADAELAETGATINLTLHVAEAVEIGEDLLVAVGGYPTELASQERDNVFTLMDAVDHPGA
jgi:hypothetical protein